MTNTFILGIFLFVGISISCFAQNRILLKTIEKEFIVRKYVKIQSDMDNLIYAHKIYQNDSLEYNKAANVNFPFYTLKKIGLNCFEYDSTGKYSTDVHINKLEVRKLANQDFDLYSAFQIFDYKYFVAIDDSGWVFLLKNFWIDDFHRFIKKKIGKIDNPWKAIDVVRIFTVTKLYNDGPGIIIEEDNVDRIKYQYQNLKSIKKLAPLIWERDDVGNFNIDAYIYFPSARILNYYNFYITQRGEINLREEAVYREEH